MGIFEDICWSSPRGPRRLLVIKTGERAEIKAEGKGFFLYVRRRRETSKYTLYKIRREAKGSHSEASRLTGNVISAVGGATDGGVAQIIAMNQARFNGSAATAARYSGRKHATA